VYYLCDHPKLCNKACESEVACLFVFQTRPSTESLGLAKASERTQTLEEGAQLMDLEQLD
jgi:hypothetical protein